MENVLLNFILLFLFGCCIFKRNANKSSIAHTLEVIYVAQARLGDFR